MSVFRTMVPRGIVLPRAMHNLSRLSTKASTQKTLAAPMSSTRYIRHTSEREPSALPASVTPETSIFIDDHGRPTIMVQSRPCNEYNLAKSSYKAQMTELRKKWTAEFKTEALARARADKALREKEALRVAAYREERNIMSNVNREMRNAETEIIKQEREEIHRRYREHRAKREKKQKAIQKRHIKKQFDAVDSYLTHEDEMTSTIRPIAIGKKITVRDTQIKPEFYY
eukprot:CFRG1513T1